jgi:hypothetical protein
MQQTTFEEYIQTCHALLSKPLHIQTDKSLSTQGSITSLKNKPCPTLLKPWMEFPIKQQQLFEKVHKYFHSPVPLTPIWPFVESVNSISTPISYNFDNTHFGLHETHD